MRILFMGTPEFAKTALFAIREAYPDEIVGVITRQDTPKNRGPYPPGHGRNWSPPA